MSKVETPSNALTYKVIGFAMPVHNELGPGRTEEMYRRALLILANEGNMHCDREFQVKALFRNNSIGVLKLDLVIERQVIIELKAVSALAAIHEQQTLTYLTASGLEVALLINFGASRLEYKRLFPSMAVQNSEAFKKRRITSQ